MRYCGISENFHNAAIAFVEEDGTISFASESERYSKRKNDPLLHKFLSDMIHEDDHVSFYEDINLRNQYSEKIANTLHNKEAALNKAKRAANKITRYKIDKSYLHHQSHAATSFYTRPWTSSEDTVCLTIDGYGEWQSATIQDNNFNILYEETYPKSIGVVYALGTKALGYKPLEEEYIVMGMAAFSGSIFLDTFEDKINLFFDGHISSQDLVLYFQGANPIDLAGTLQAWTEKEILKLANRARKYGSKLVYSGGVAQNIVANSMIRNLFDDMWIAVNSTDGGSALGAAARSWALNTGKDRLLWEDAYLGYDEKSNINPARVASYLNSNFICGVINGKAEFGPRALGNRSLLADPRKDIKETVNKVKNREKFRPFAPVILEEFSEEYFEGHKNEYMQYTSNAKHDYKSVTHVDGTARVQIVTKDSTSIIRPILEEFYNLSGIPMLLNTSLNVRGNPICNDKYDGKLFYSHTSVKVWHR